MNELITWSISPESQTWAKLPQERNCLQTQCHHRIWIGNIIAYRVSPTSRSASLWLHKRKLFLPQGRGKSVQSHPLPWGYPVVMVVGYLSCSVARDTSILWKEGQEELVIPAAWLLLSFHFSSGTPGVLASSEPLHVDTFSSSFFFFCSFTSFLQIFTVGPLVHK